MINPGFLGPRLAQIPAHVELNKIWSDKKAADEANLQRYITDQSLPTIMDDIVNTQRENEKRSLMIDGLIQKLSAPPPEAPTQLNFSMGEGITGVLASLFGGGVEAANGVANVAANRQQKAFENKAAAFAQSQQGLGLQLRQAQGDQDFLRTALERKKAGLSERQENIARMKFSQGESQAALKADIAGKQADMKNEIVQAARDHRYKMQMEQAKAENEIAMERFKSSLRVQESALVEKGKQKNTKLDFVLKGLEYNTDPALVEGVVSDLRAEGFDISDDMAAVLMERARHNLQEEETRKAAATLNQNKFNHDVTQDNLALGLDAAKIVNSGGQLPPAIAGKFGLPTGPPVKPGSVASPEGAKTVYKDFNFGGLKSSLSVPAFVDQRPPFTGDDDLNRLIDSVQKQMDLAARAEKLKTVKQSGDAGADEVRQRKANEERAKIQAEADALTSTIQTLRASVNSRATPEFKEWREGVRKYVVAQIKKAGDAKNTESSNVQSTWRKVYQVLTGDDKP